MKKILLLSCILLNNQVLAASLPRSVTADKHIKMIAYDVNNVVMLKGHYGYQTEITFSPNEIIQNVAIGDSMAWQAIPVGNHLFIKPVADSDTNMTVLTNTKSYHFHLDSSDDKSPPTYQVQFKYAAEENDANCRANALAIFDPEQLNWQYSFTGARALAPVQAFDDGQFTFFKFKQNGKQHLPAVFMVDDNRHESLVNYHMQGNYLVVNTVAKQFTLRDGKHVTSIYNDAAIAKQ